MSQFGKARAPRRKPKKEGTTFNRDRVAKLLGLIGSMHDAEALAAMRKVYSELNTAGLTWHDVVGPGGSELAEQLAVATAAVQRLLLEKEALEREVSDLRAKGAEAVNAEAADAWQDLRDPHAEAHWALALDASGKVALADGARLFGCH